MASIETAEAVYKLLEEPLVQKCLENIASPNKKANTELFSTLADIFSRRNGYNELIRLLWNSIPNFLSYFNEIPVFGFLRCDWLAEVKIPDNITKICNSAFYECTNLAAVELPDSITEIGNYAFSHTDIQKITIPKSVTLIGRCAFSCCDNLNTAIIEGNSDCVISAYAFNGCENLCGVIINDAYEIQDAAFINCTRLLELDLPASPCSLTKIALGKDCGYEHIVGQLDIPMELKPEEFLDYTLKKKVDREFVAHNYNFQMNFNNISFKDGREFIKYLDTAVVKVKIAVPTLYRIGEPGRWSILVYGANKKNPVDICMRGPLGGGQDSPPVFFTSYNDAKTFIDNLNSSKRISTFVVPYSRIYQAKLQEKDYIDNFTKINTIAGPCYIQTPKAKHVNPAAIIKKNVF